MNADQAKALKKEASALHQALFDKLFFGSDTPERMDKAQRIYRKAGKRYDRRSELYADIKWPNRHKSKAGTQ